MMSLLLVSAARAFRSTASLSERGSVNETVMVSGWGELAMTTRV
jgi:hypothetical protein